MSELIATVSPFHAERLHLDLTAYAPERESVHEADFPSANPGLIDEALNAQMSTIHLEAVRHPALDAAFTRHGDYVRAETLCEGVTFVDRLESEAVLVEETSLLLRVRAVA